MENSVTVPRDRYDELLRKETQVDTIFAARNALPNYDFEKYLTCLEHILGYHTCAAGSENNAE